MDDSVKQQSFEAVSAYGAHAIVSRFLSNGRTITRPSRIADAPGTIGLVEIHDGDWVLFNGKNMFTVMNDKEFHQRWEIIRELPEVPNATN